jgi:hypothetical protein
LGIFRRLILKAKGEYHFLDSEAGVGEPYAKALTAAAKREVAAWKAFEKECWTICGHDHMLQFTEPEVTAHRQLIAGVFDSQLKLGRSIAALDTALGLRRHQKEQADAAAAAAEEAAAEAKAAADEEAKAAAGAEGLADDPEWDADAGAGGGDYGFGEAKGDELVLVDEPEEVDGENGGEPITPRDRTGAEGSFASACEAVASAVAMTEALATCHIELYKGDWRKWYYSDAALKETLAKAIQLFIPDPPYGVLRKKRDRIGDHEMLEVVAAAKYFVHPTGTVLIFCAWQQASR